MPTLHRLAREQCEKAFANYINGHKASSPLVTPTEVDVRVRKGKLNNDGTFILENLDELPLPCLAVSCPRVKPHESMGYAICDLHVLVLTSVDEENAATLAASRFGYIAELLSDDKLETLKTAMNKPDLPGAPQFGLPDVVTADGNELTFDVAHGYYVSTGQVPGETLDGYTLALSLNFGTGRPVSLILHQYSPGLVTVGIWQYRIQSDGTFAPELEDAPVLSAITLPQDNRAIKDFNIFGFYLAEDSGQETDRHWIDHLVFEVHCNPTDDVDGDGSV